jgi:hypothetical protein
MSPGAGVAIALGAAVVVGGGIYLYVRGRDGGGRGGGGDAGYGGVGAGEFGGGGGGTLPSAFTMAKETGIRRIGGSVFNYGKDLTGGQHFDAGPRTITSTAAANRSRSIAAGRAAAYSRPKTQVNYSKIITLGGGRQLRSGLVP